VQNNLGKDQIIDELIMKFAIKETDSPATARILMQLHAFLCTFFFKLACGQKIGIGLGFGNISTLHLYI